MNVVKRQGPLFILDDSKLSEKAKTTPIKNALYAEIYLEFIDAAKNPKYSNLTPLEKFNKVNEFAEKWLKDRKLL